MPGFKRPSGLPSLFLLAAALIVLTYPLLYEACYRSVLGSYALSEADGSRAAATRITSGWIVVAVFTLAVGLLLRSPGVASRRPRELFIIRGFTVIIYIGLVVALSSRTARWNYEINFRRDRVRFEAYVKRREAKPLWYIWERAADY